MTTVTAPATTTLELVWGQDDHERQSWTGSEAVVVARAQRAYLAARRSGAAVALYADGVLLLGGDHFAGEEVAEATTHRITYGAGTDAWENSAGRMVREPLVSAWCSCGTTVARYVPSDVRRVMVSRHRAR